jgi:hypothetical protein
MIQKVSVPVTVYSIFDHSRRSSHPVKIKWEGREYPVTKVGFHHTYYQGRTLFHVFSVASPNLFFRLVLNTQNLFWTLEEIADGQPD